MAESAITFEGWRYAHYFEFIRRIDRNVTVRCKLCPGQKLLSTAVNTTSNLNKHLQRTHAKVKLIAKDPRTQSEDVVSAPPPIEAAHIRIWRTGNQSRDGQACSIIHSRGNVAHLHSGITIASFRDILRKIQIAGDRGQP
ncbi:hypothetical protein OYC64_005388 [Pagothenia borchgrevinki]|uniref:BED-type domain-containing protein n=1 Tax=Pagothenia borchgrevinki TaxID=8213 RepID=A0ABD2GHG7_PAGBO